MSRVSFIRVDDIMTSDVSALQMVSLLHLADITEEGVTFESPLDGSPMLLTPEHSIAIQNRLGAQLYLSTAGSMQGFLAPTSGGRHVTKASTAVQRLQQHAKTLSRSESRVQANL